MSDSPKRVYSVEDFSELISTRLQRLESRTEARQGYGTVLAALRQQLETHRRQMLGGK